MTDKELVEQIYHMCEADEKSERERQHYYQTQAKGDPASNLQYGSTSHGCALQAAKVRRFINSVRKEVEDSRANLTQEFEAKGFKTGIEAAASMVEPKDKMLAQFIRSLKV